MKKGKSRKRVSFINALNTKNLIAPFVFEGSCTRELFEIFLKEVLVPKLKPGQILILDNASIHKGGNINEIVSKAGRKLIYLPTYSPDLNPIENCWSFVKTKIKKFLSQGKELFDAVVMAFE